jgi:hypothetical protein
MEGGILQEERASWMDGEIIGRVIQQDDARSGEHEDHILHLTVGS